MQFWTKVIRIDRTYLLLLSLSCHLRPIGEALASLNEILKNVIKLT